ncbi:MAG: aminoacetone oxidase family FAD-binding enzyme [Flavobacteriales bacterium]|nr:aminoacetone oxidase family FAD-binding enzyme [Flavobacteriales bacterium]
MHKQVVIVGGGAAGFFAALNLADGIPGTEILILEKSNKLLSKVKVSGGGRCNVTHACFEQKELSKYYPRGEKELLGPFHRFYTSDTIGWFADRDIELKVEEDGRMFPSTDSSQTIIDCFLNEAENRGISIWKQAEVKSVRRTDRFEISLADGKVISSDYLIIAAGGHPKKKAYEWIEKLGHQIKDPIPSLFTFNLPKHPSNELMGLSQQANIKILGTNEEAYGPLLFTHWGMSGPAVLKLSARAADYLHSKNYKFKFEVEWLPNAGDFINEQRKHAANKQVNLLKPEEFSKRFWAYLLDRAGIAEKLNWADLNKQQLMKLEEVLEKDLYHAEGKTTFKEEFVTCGGVDLKGIDMKTMESKKVKGLYFAGEVINVDGLTGGFNFQAAWTTGFIAASAINQSLEPRI